MSIHNFCSVCKRDFYAIEDFDAHRSPIKIRVGICLSEAQMSVLADPVYVEDGIWSVSSRHETRKTLSARLEKARAARSKKSG